MAYQNGPARAQTLSRRSLLIAGGAAVAVPGLAACGQGDPELQGDAEPDPEPTGPNEAGAAGGALTLGVAVPFGSFDPYVHITSNFVVLLTMYDYLVVYDADLVPHPALAESWEVSADNTEVTIVLREATFHSGNPVTADDVVAGVERAQDPELGANQFNSSQFIASAEAVDERTVRLMFAQPTQEDEVTDWMNVFPVVEAAQNDPEALQSGAAGSGPFMLDTLSPGVSLTMTKNPDYWDEGKPYLDSVEIRFFDDQDALVSALQAGDIDGALYLSSRYTDQLSGQFTNVVGASDALIDLFYMNPSLPPFDNADLRRALARAINRERIIEQVRFGAAEPIYAPLGPNSAAFDSTYLEEYAFDLDEAKAMLDAAGGGRSATAAVQPAPGVSEIMQIIQADFASIGFELEIEPMEQAAWVEQFRAGKLQVAVGAGGNSWRTPSPTSAAVALENNAFWPDGAPPADFVDAMNAVPTAITPEEQEQVYRAINEAYLDHAWAIGIATRPSLHSLTPQVEGFARDEGDHIVLTDVTVR